METRASQSIGVRVPSQTDESALIDTVSLVKCHRHFKWTQLGTWLMQTARREWGESNINYLLSWRHMPCRQQWQLSGISRCILSLHTHRVAALQSPSEFIKPWWSYHRIMCRKRKKIEGLNRIESDMWHSFFFIRDPHCCSRWIPKNVAQPHNTPMWSPRPGAAHTHTHTVMRAHLLRYQKNPIQIALTPTWQIENQSEKKRMLNYCRSKTDFKHERSEVHVCFAEKKKSLNGIYYASSKKKEKKRNPG